MMTTDLETEAREAVSWVREYHNVNEAREEDDIAILVYIALAGFKYDRLTEANDQLRLAGQEAVDEQTRIDMGDHSLAVDAIKDMRARFPDGNWKGRLRKWITRLNELRPSEEK